MLALIIRLKRTTSLIITKKKNTASMNLSNLKYLIFDEADRMLDLGFEREMNDCLSQIKKKCLDKFKNPS